MVSEMLKTKGWGRAVVCLLLVGLVSHLACFAAEAPVEATDKARIRQTVVNGFTHPGIAFNKETLEEVRALVLAKRDPWYSGFVRFASSPRSAKNVSSRNQSK
jgi:hypothetical protein